MVYKMFKNSRFFRTRHRHPRIHIQTIRNAIIVCIAIQRIRHELRLRNVRQTVAVRVFSQGLKVNSQQQAILDKFIIGSMTHPKR